MTTLIAIVEDAYSRIGVLAESQALTADQGVRGLRLLNALLNNMPNFNVGTPMETVTIEGDHIIDKPSRLYVKGSAAKTITLPADPYDGYRVKIVDVGSGFGSSNVTILPNGNMLRAVSTNILLNVSSVGIELFFNADNGNWVDVTHPMPQGDDVPFDPGFDDGLSAMLAVKLAGHVDAVVTPEIHIAAAEVMTELRDKYRPDMTMSFDRSLVRVPSQLNRF